MKEGFRQAMAWLHTWTGLIFGWVLFAIFLTGTLSYFKDEISHWMQPEVPLRSVSSEASLTLAQHYLQQHAADAGRWVISLPSARDPGLSVSWQMPGNEGRRGPRENRQLDPLSGEEIQVRDSRAGDFFFRFHYQLQMPHPWGRWLTTSAAMLMLVALISGIIIHKKIFKDFFTFRPRKGQRSWLDGHNAVGVLVLPFHLMITYSSLVIFMYMVMPVSILVAYKGDTESFFSELFPASTDAPPAAGQPGQLLALAPFIEKAQAHWGGGRVNLVTVSHPGDLKATVNIMRSGADRVAYAFGSAVSFDGVNGQFLGADPQRAAPMMLAGTFYGLHLGNFAGTALRWLYFICGLAGTAMIGTGLVIWLGKRQLKHAKSAAMPFELRLVEVANIASMSGLVIAVAAYFWANRLLPVSFAERAEWEVNSFFITWGLSLVHAALRPGRKAWVEQLTLAALLFASVPLLNALTTSSGLLRSLIRGDGAMLGFDLTCLGGGLFLAWAAWKMQRVTALAPKGAERARKVPLAQRVS